MRKCWRRLVSLALSAVLCLSLLPTQALAALVDNTSAQNRQILAQLKTLTGDETTAEQVLAMLKEYGLVNKDGTIRTDWSGEIYLQEEGQSLTFAEAMELQQGTVTVNGRTCDAARLRQTLRTMEGMGLLPGGAPAGDWALTVDGQSVAPAELEGTLAAAQEAPAESQTPTESETPVETAAPAEAGGGILSAIGRFLGMGGGLEPAGPVVTVLGAPVDGETLLEVISFLAEYGLLTETGAAAEWNMTRPGEERAVTAEEITAMVEDGSLSPDAVVTVDGSPITVRDLQTILDIEAELKRIQETYFPEGDVELSREQAEALLSLYNQLLADGGFELYNSQGADALSAASFPSGIDRSARVTLNFSGYSAVTSAGGTFNMTWDVSDDSDVSFKLRVLNGSGTGLSFPGTSETVLTCEGNGGTQALSLTGWDTGWNNDNLWNGQHVVFVQAYDLEGALFSNGENSITQTLVLNNEKTFSGNLPIQWSVSNGSQTYTLTDSQQYLLRNGMINNGQWSYTTSGYKGNTCFVDGGTVGVDDALWKSATLSSGFSRIGSLTTYYYQYLKVAASVGNTLIFGKEVGYPGDVADELDYESGFSGGYLQAIELDSSAQRSYYDNNSKETAVSAVANSNPATDSVLSASGTISQEALQQLGGNSSVTLSASGKWTAAGTGREQDAWSYKWGYGLRCSDETAANVTMSVTLTDNQAPTVTGITFPTVSAGQEFPAGTQVPVMVTFSELVQSDGVTITANGVTCPVVETGTYSKTLTFLYPVAAVDNRYIKVTAVSGVKDISGNPMSSSAVSFQSDNILDQTPTLRDAVLSTTLTAEAGKLTYTPASENQPAKTTSEVTVELLLPTAADTANWQDFRNLLLASTPDQDNRYVSTVLEGVVAIGGENRVVPLVLDDSINPTKLAATFEIDVLELLENRNFVLELREVASKKWIFQPYASFSIDPPVPLTAAAISVTQNSWPEGDVFVDDPPKGLSLSATVLNPTNYTWSGVEFYSSNESVARISADGAITLYGSGDVDFYVRATNGGLEEYRDENQYPENTGTYCKKVASLSVGEGYAPYLLIPESSITARAGEAVTLRWASNLVQKNIQYAGETTATTFTLKVYEGDGTNGKLVQTHTITYDPNTPDGTITMGNGTSTMPMWTVNGDVLTPNQSFTLSGLTNTTTAGRVSYTLELSAATDGAVPGGQKTFTQTAAVTILSRPVTVTLKRPGSFYQVNSGTLELGYTLTNYDEGNEAEFRLVVTDNADGREILRQNANETLSKAEDGTYTGTFTIDLGAVKPENNFRTIYDVSLQAKNPADDAWSRDSFTLYIYDADALSIQVQSVTRDGIPVVTVNGGKVTMSNEDWIASLDQDQILALNRDIDLQAGLSINYAEHPWGEASDRVVWSSGDSGIAAVNYPQGAYYEDVEDLPYTSYAPATEFLLSGKGDGTTVVEAIHALAGDALSDSVEVTVETLKDKLYLFQFYPAGTVQFSYINGEGQAKTGTTDAAGRAAVYEESGITSNVYAGGTIDGEKYLGTVYQEDLVSQEKDAVSLELYPLNTITMRKAATLPVYLKNPNGTPYTGTVQIRAGVYRNGEWCEEAYVDPKTNPKNLGKTEDFPASFVDGEYTFQFDLTQFSTASQPNADTDNPVTAADEIQFVLEIRADGYYPVFFSVYGSLNEDDAVRLAQRVVNLEKVPAGQENKPFIARQAVYFSGQESGIGTDVRNKSGKVGPSSAYPDLLLSTTVFWWGDSGEGSRTVHFVDETGTDLTRQTVTTENVYPFCSMPVSHITVPLDETQLKDLNVASLGARTLKLQYTSGGTVVKEESMPWLFINALTLENVTQSKNLRESVEAMAQMLASTTSDGVSVGNDFLTIGIALATQMNISVPLISMKLSPTKDPTTFRGLIAVGLNNFEDDNVSGVDADGGRGSDLDATPGLDALKGVYSKGVGGYLNSLGKQFEAAASILEANTRGGTSGASVTTDRKPYFAIQGWFEIEVTFDFENQEWVFTTLTGGATGGGGIGYEWTWNFQAGPIPLVAQLELGAAASLSFTSLWNADDRGEDYLTQLRLYAYLQFFGGIGFDYAIVALKLGLYGRVGLEAQIEWLNRANGEVWDGQKLDVTGEVGAKFQVEALYFISYEKILWSHSVDVYSGTFGSDFDKIEKYWDEALTGAGASSEFIQPSEGETSVSSRAARASLLATAANGIGIYSADLDAAFLDRDYLQKYTRTYDSSAPTLAGERTGGFSLMSLFSNASNTETDNSVVQTIMDSYTQAGPVLSDDGGYLFYLSDLGDQGDATKVRVAYAKKNTNNAGYDVSEDERIIDNDGYGDSGVSASGSGDEVAVVWSRVMEEPAITEPGQSVTSDIQAQMLKDSDILVAVPDDSGGWTVTNLTEDNGVGDLSPVVARKGDNIFVAWRQVASTDTVDVTNFNARDYIYYSYSEDGGTNWTTPAPIYNGTSGSVKGIQAAMLPDGTAAAAFTLEGAGQNVAAGKYNQNVAYAVVGQNSEGGYNEPRYVVIEDENLDENPQLAAVDLNGTPAFILGWHSVSAADGSSDIRLAAIDGGGNRVNGFVDALSDLIANSDTVVSANFQFVQNADALDTLSILWSGTVEDETPSSGNADETTPASRGVIYGLRFRTVEENGYTKVSVTAAQQLMEMPDWTTVDSFSAYVDGSGYIRAAVQGTYYDYNNLEPVPVEYGNGDADTVYIPGERTDLLTAVGAYTDTIRVDSVIPDYEHIHKGASVPVQLSLTNLGTQPITQVTVTIGGQTTTFKPEDAFVAIAPGQTRNLTAFYTVPSGENTAIPNPEYTVSAVFANGTEVSSDPDALALNVPDLGIADKDILLEAADGSRVLQFTLFNNSDAQLTGSNRSVKLAVYSDPSCTKPIDTKYFTQIAALDGEDGVLLTVDGAELAKIDDGSYTVQFRFDLASYIQQELNGETPFMDEDGEVRDEGVTLYAKVWVEGTDAASGQTGELVEYVTTNNSAAIRLDSLLKQANGKPVTLTSQLSQPQAGGTQVDVTLRNNSIVNSQDGNLIVTIFDANGNKLAAQQSYTGGSVNQGLVRLSPEENKTFTFSFTQSGAARAEVTYSKTVLDGDNNSVSQLTFQGIPVTLEDFVQRGDGVFAASAQVSRMDSTWVNAVTANPNASVTVNGAEMPLGGTGFSLSSGTNVLTVTVTSPDGSQTATYELTIDNSYPSGGGGSSYYSVDVAETAHGTVTVQPVRARQGSKVTITARPDEGYQVDTVTVTRANGAAVAVTANPDGTYTFVMPNGRVTVEVTFTQGEPAQTWRNPYTDVAEDAWYYDAVRYVSENGLMNGTGAGTFSPGMTTSRGMIVTILWRLEGSPEAAGGTDFPDVDPAAWYGQAVRWAAGAGIVTGYDNGLFGPNDTITREQMAAILYRYAQYKGCDTTASGDLSRYTDADQISPYALPAMRWANGAGLITGTSASTLNPQGSATRAEAAAILARFCQNIAV